jgi:uncharacterized protein (TIRG00374 family)
VVRILRGIYNLPLLRIIRSHFPTYQHFEDYVIHRLDNVFAPINRVTTNPLILAKLAGISVAAWMVFYGGQYVVFHGLGARASFVHVIIITTIATFLGDIAISPGGVGFMEAAMLALCAALGIDKTDAAAVTLVTRGIYYAYGVALGGLSLLVLTLIYGRRAPQEP